MSPRSTPMSMRFCDAMIRTSRLACASSTAAPSRRCRRSSRAPRLDPILLTRLTDALIGAAVDHEGRSILARLELKSFAPVGIASYDVTLAFEKEAMEKSYPEIA